MQAKTRNHIGNNVVTHAQNAAEEIQSTGVAAWDRAKDLYQTAQDKAVNGVKVADRTIRKNPYQSIGIAFGVGLLVGLIYKRNK